MIASPDGIGALHASSVGAGLVPARRVHAYQARMNLATTSEIRNPGMQAPYGRFLKGNPSGSRLSVIMSPDAMGTKNLSRTPMESGHYT